MDKQKLHPSIEEFKNFIKKHPKLIQEVRNGNKSWQELYEDWYLLGETDEVWEKYSISDNKDEKQSSKQDFMTKVFSSLKGVEISDVQKQITNVGSAISTIQQVIHQFQGSKNTDEGSTQEHNGNPNPFSFRKD
jgi:hypothetical protein